jgi:hypothetical protein
MMESVSPAVAMTIGAFACEPSNHVAKYKVKLHEGTPKETGPMAINRRRFGGGWLRSVKTSNRSHSCMDTLEGAPKNMRTQGQAQVTITRRQGRPEVMKDVEKSRRIRSG